MAFQTGESGNPNGRPKGSLNKRTELMRLLDANGEDILKALIELALNGDIKALQLCVERLIPKAKSLALNEPIQVDDTQNPSTWSSALNSIVKSTLLGEISPDDAKKLIELIEKQKNKIEGEKFMIDF